MNGWKIAGLGITVFSFFLLFYFYTGDSKGQKPFAVEGIRSVDSL